MWERLVGAGPIKGKQALENSQKNCSKQRCNKPRVWHSDYCRKHDKQNQEQALRRKPLFPGLSGTFEVLTVIGFYGVIIFIIFKIGSCVF